jgi:glycosyltransferase involved in cell wall biosynthesis
MIVKNEERTLENCLKSVQDIVDEIVIVDTGSKDNTKEIASKYTDKVFDFEWIDDFSAARNFSFKQATMDYIMWLDADDVLLPNDRTKLQKLKQSLEPDVDAVSMAYHCAFDDHGNVTLSVRRIRLVKRQKNYQWIGVVHEDLCVSGKVYDSDIAVTHKKVHKATDRNLKIYEKYIQKGGILTPRDMFHYARESHHHKRYNDAVDYYLKYLNTDQASKEDKIFIYGKLADCYHHLGDKDKELYYTLQTFQHDIPRSEICCRLGYYFLEKKEYIQAIFWYNLATQLPKPLNSWAIVNEPSRTWLPHLQLGLCYYQLGEYRLSYHHYRVALSYRPNDKNIISNLNILKELMSTYPDQK